MGFVFTFAGVFLKVICAIVVVLVAVCQHILGIDYLRSLTTKSYAKWQCAQQRVRYLAGGNPVRKDTNHITGSEFWDYGSNATI